VVVPLISPFWSRPGPVLHALEQPVGHDLQCNNTSYLVTPMMTTIVDFYLFVFLSGQPN